MKNFQRKTTKTTRKHLPTGKHRKLHGSTEYLVGNNVDRQEFDNKRDCIVTATIEAAEDLKRKLANRIESRSNDRQKSPENCYDLTETPWMWAYALNEIYSGIPTQEGTRSLTLDGYDRNKLHITTKRSTWPTNKLAKQS
ncbi:hypothetical protein EVAR_85876_1 [Eumeta japonica]|uniref:Uncharacterized protein n=1 Tax=Eumeta variegata TaxID=151549 RepID=A0A4C2A2F1_EUMVA|nr:hypothetical protein EVAR_85876_1 [Eumeta japonica]